MNLAILKLVSRVSRVLRDFPWPRSEVTSLQIFIEYENIDEDNKTLLKW